MSCEVIDVGESTTSDAASDAAWTTIATAGVINNVAFATGAFRLTAASIITGVVAQADGTEIVIHNASSVQMTVSSDNNLSTAANRFTASGSGSTFLKPGQAVRYKYSTAVSRWILSTQQNISVSTPMSLSNNNSVSIATSSSVSNGVLSATDWNTFNNKVGGSGSVNHIAYFSGSSTIASDLSKLTWNPTNDRLGVQVAAADTDAAMHLNSATSIPIANATTFTSGLTQVNALTEPSGSTALTQALGRLMPPTSPTATENSSGVTPWGIGDTMEYKISPYNDTASLITEGKVPTDFVLVTFVGANNGVALTWTNVAGAVTRTGYYLYRNYNSGGFVERLDIGNVSSYTDDNQDTWDSVAGYPANAVYADYVANGTSRDYAYYSRAVIAPGPYFSALNEIPATFTDDNSGNPYGVSHDLAGPEPLGRIIGDPDGFSNGFHIDVTIGVAVVEYSDTWVADGTFTPSTVGYLSDGAILERSYSYYRSETVNGSNAYSSGLATNVSDPNDGNYYFVTLSVSQTAGSGGWYVNDVDANGYIQASAGTSLAHYDTGNAYGTDFPDSTAVGPIGVIPPALLVEKGGAEADFAWLTIRGNDDYARMQFVDSADATQGAIDSSATEMNLKYGTTKNIRLNATQLGFYGVTKVSRATTGITASAFVANTSGIVDDTATFGGYTLGQIVAALKAIGILT